MNTFDAGTYMLSRKKNPKRFVKSSRSLSTFLQKHPTRLVVKILRQQTKFQAMDYPKSPEMQNLETRARVNLFRGDFREK